MCAIVEPDGRPGAPILSNNLMPHTSSQAPTLQLGHRAHRRAASFWGDRRRRGTHLDVRAHDSDERAWATSVAVSLSGGCVRSYTRSLHRTTARGREMSERSWGTADADEGGGGARATDGRGPAERYGAAVQQLFDSDHVVREALRDKLVDVTAQSLELRAEAATAFSGFYPSRIPAADRGKTTYFAPGDDLVELQTEQTNGSARATAGGGRRRPVTPPPDARPAGNYRYHRRERPAGRADPADRAPRAAARLGAAAAGRSDIGVPRGGPSRRPAESDHEASDTARRRHQSGRRATQTPGRAEPPTRGSAARRPEPVPPQDEPNRAEVLAKIKELLAAMRTPETAPAFEVPARRRPGHGPRRPEPPSNYVPARQMSPPYHDFTSLRIAFQGVWTEIFDGQLEASARRALRGGGQAEDLRRPRPGGAVDRHPRRPRSA